MENTKPWKEHKLKTMRACLYPFHGVAPGFDELLGWTICTPFRCAKFRFRRSTVGASFLIFYTTIQPEVGKRCLNGLRLRSFGCSAEAALSDAATVRSTEMSVRAFQMRNVTPRSPFLVYDRNSREIW